MKNSKKILPLIALLGMTLWSCRKSEQTSTGIVRTLAADTEYAAVSCFTSGDGHLIVAGRPFDNSPGGIIYKIDHDGREIWRKPVPVDARYLVTVFQDYNGGYVVMGRKEEYGQDYYFCRHDANGKLISVKSDMVGSSAATEVLRLKNGNVVVAYSNTVMGYSDVCLYDSAFNRTMKSTITENTDYFGCLIRGIQELDDKTIVFAGSAVKMNTANYRVNAMFVKMDLKGRIISRNILEDSTTSETPGGLMMRSGGLLCVTSSMIGWQAGQGTFVDYYGNSNAQGISGTLNLLQLDTSGYLISRKKMHPYPGNGIFMSSKRTSDGGYILLGTVNQNNSQTIVSNTQLFLLKLNANMETEWSRQINTQYQAIGMDVIELDNGDFFLTGHQRSFNRKFNILAIKVSRTGLY